MGHILLSELSYWLAPPCVDGHGGARRGTGSYSREDFPSRENAVARQCNAHAFPARPLAIETFDFGSNFDCFFGFFKVSKSMCS